MNNLIDKTISVKLGKIEAALKFDWNAIAALEEKTGKGLGELLGAKGPGGEITPGMLASAPFSTIRLLVWAAVQHQMPCSVEDIGALMSFRDAPAISAAVMRALNEQFADPGNEAVADATGDPDPNDQQTSGLRSGQLDATISD